jgi:hypothetical protein
MQLAMTLHAQKRLQQRGIPHFVVDLLDAFGATERCGGAERLYFDRAARARMNRTQGGDAIPYIEKWLRVYAVVSDTGALITVAHRRRRLKRK